MRLSQAFISELKYEESSAFPIFNAKIPFRITDYQICKSILNSSWQNILWSLNILESIEVVQMSSYCVWKWQPSHKHKKQQIWTHKNILPASITDSHQTENYTYIYEEAKNNLFINEDTTNQMHIIWREWIPECVMT